MKSQFSRNLPSLPIPVSEQSVTHGEPVSFYGISERMYMRVKEDSDRPRSADLTAGRRLMHDNMSRVMYGSFHHSNTGSPTYSDDGTNDCMPFTQNFFPRNDLSTPPTDFEPLSLLNPPPASAFEFNIQQSMASLGFFQYSLTTTLLEKEEVLYREGCPLCGHSTEDASYAVVACPQQGCCHVFHGSCLMDNPKSKVNHTHFPFAYPSSTGPNGSPFMQQHRGSRPPVYSHHMHSSSVGSGIVEDANGQYILEISIMHILSNYCFFRYSGMMQSFKTQSMDFDRIAMAPELLGLLPRIPVRTFRLLLIIRSRSSPDVVHYQSEWSLIVKSDESEHYTLGDSSLVNTANVTFQCVSSVCSIMAFFFDFLVCSPKKQLINLFNVGVPDSGRIDSSQSFMMQNSIHTSGSLESSDSTSASSRQRKERGSFSSPSCSGYSGISNLQSSASLSQSLGTTNTSLSITNDSIQNYVGRLVEVSSTQSGSKTLQELLKMMKPEDWAAIEDEIIDNSELLITNQFGNYFIQKVIKDCPLSLSNRILEGLKPQMAKICCHKTGTYAIQNIIGNIIQDSQAHIIAEGIQDDLLTILLNQQSIHVMNKFLNRFEPPYFQFLIDFLQSSFNQITYNQFGITILRSCLQKCSKEQRDVIIQLILDHALKLCWDEYGNYAVQYLLDFVEDIGPQVYERLKGNVVEMSQNKYGSNVIEKCLQSGAGARSHIISELVESTEIARLMTDRYSNFVIQKAIQVAVGAERKQLCNCIKPNLNVFIREGKTVQNKWKKFVELLEKD